MAFREKTSIRETIEHIGVSNARLCVGTLVRGGLVIPVIVKQENNIYALEVKGARLLRDHLPIVETIAYENGDTAIYPLIGNACTLSEVLTDPEKSPVSLDLLIKFLSMHVDMWNDTHTFQVFHHTGYPKKLTETRKAVLNRTIGRTQLFESGNLPFRINLNRYNSSNESVREEFVVQSVSDGLAWMEGQVKDSLKFGISLTHGDESFGNCLVRNPDVSGINYASPLVMIDLNGAGYRSPFESIAKIISWFRVSQAEHQSFRYGTDITQSSSELIVNYFLDQRYLEMEDQIVNFMRLNLQIFVGLDPDVLISHLKAFQMMYLLREAAFYTDRRNRPEIVPYLIASAFSLAGTKTT